MLLLWGFCYPPVSGHSAWLTESLLAARVRLTVTLWAPVHIQSYNAYVFPAQTTCCLNKRIATFLFTQVHPAITLFTQLEHLILSSANMQYIYIYIYIYYIYIIYIYYIYCSGLHAAFLCILNKSWQQHPTRHQLYGHLPPITKTIQVRRTRHAGHCWRSRDELIRDVLLWIPTHGRAKAGRPARTYIQQLCEDTGCCPEDLPRAMNDREEWRERVRDIRAASTILWWWWWYICLKCNSVYYGKFHIKLCVFIKYIN